MRMLALHGFLGEPADWSILSGAVAPDLFAAPWDWASWRSGGLEAAGRAANSFAEGAETLSGNRWLLGYSMGARIAMHALLSARPGIWKGAILVSGHPGLPRVERETRRTSDEAWARRFENCSPEDWASLVEQWNEQGVFSGSRNRAGSPPFEKRAHYARALRSGSLGEQEDLRGALSALDLPVLWVTGGKDRKFSDLAVQAARPGFHLEIAAAGHRVPWDATEEFVRAIEAFKEKYQ